MNIMTLELTECPVCNTREMELFDKVIGPSVNSDILICNACHALVSVTAYRELKNKALEDVQNSQFYGKYESTRSAHAAGVESGAAVIRDLLSISGIDPSEKTLLDFGAGRGYFAIAATRHFKQVYACEMDTKHISSISALFELNNLRIVRDMQSIQEKIDVLFMWHTLEHLPDPTVFWTNYSSILSQDAIVFLQIPMYRPRHVVDSHYIFYTEKSLSTWAFNSLGAKPIHFGYDIENGFLGMMAKRGE